MKLVKEHGYWRIETKNSHLSFINEWSQILERCNWYTFTLITIDAENDIAIPGHEFRVIIFGLGFHFRRNKSWEGTEIQKVLNEAKEQYPDVFSK